MSIHEPCAIAASSTIMRLCASVCVCVRLERERASVRMPVAARMRFRSCKGARVSVGGQRNLAAGPIRASFSVAHAAPKLVMLHLVLEVEESITQKLPEIVRSYNLQARAAHLAFQHATHTRPSRAGHCSSQRSPATLRGLFLVCGMLRHLGAHDRGQRRRPATAEVRCGARLPRRGQEGLRRHRPLVRRPWFSRGTGIRVVISIYLNFL